MNEYERAFVRRMSKYGINGPSFARLTREVFEAEFGGEGDAFLKDFPRETLEDPERFASEVYRTFGDRAEQYYVQIVRYLNSGKFNPEEEAEEESEEEELESIIDKLGTDSVEVGDSE